MKPRDKLDKIIFGSVVVIFLKFFGFTAVSFHRDYFLSSSLLFSEESRLSAGNLIEPKTFDAGAGVLTT